MIVLHPWRPKTTQSVSILHTYSEVIELLTNLNFELMAGLRVEARKGYRMIVFIYK